MTEAMLQVIITGIFAILTAIISAVATIWSAHIQNSNANGGHIWKVLAAVVGILAFIILSCAFLYQNLNAISVVDRNFDAVISAPNGHIYALRNAHMTWKEADNFCNNLGGHLATITTEVEQKIVEALIADENLTYQSGYWLGGERAFDKNGNAKWQWVTGESMDAQTYTNWEEHQPSGGSIESRMQIFGKSTTWPTYKWDDCREDSQISFICEWDS